MALNLIIHHQENHFNSQISKGVIFDSASSQWNQQYINGKYYDKWINVYHQDEWGNWRKQIFDSSGNHLRTADYTLSRVIYDEDRYSVDLRQSDHSQFTEIFNENEIINFIDGNSDSNNIVGTNKDEIINTHDGTDVITPSGGEDL